VKASHVVPGQGEKRAVRAPSSSGSRKKKKENREQPRAKGKKGNALDFQMGKGAEIIQATSARGKEKREVKKFRFTTLGERGEKKGGDVPTSVSCRGRPCVGITGKKKGGKKEKGRKGAMEAWS